MVSRFLSAVYLLLVLVAWPACAQQTADRIRVDISGGELIDLPRPAANVFIADSAIADVQAPSGNSIFIYGKKPGTTMLFALDSAGKQILKREIVVSYNMTEVTNILRSEVSGATVTATSTPTGIVLSGTVSSAEGADKLRTVATRYLTDKDQLIDQVQITGPQQVNLRVRVAEVSRTVTKDLGFNWSSLATPGAFSFGLFNGRVPFLESDGTTTSGFLTSGGSLVRASPLLQGGALPGAAFSQFTAGRVTVNNLIDALAEEGLVTVLAEPNLTAISGQSASFLAGGEFPIPVSQAGTNSNAITVEFKQFGVSLDFVPTVIEKNLISIKVRPEVSELSNQGAVTVNGLTVPAITVRRAETTVELGSGDSFAIAGLIQNNTTNDVNKFPGLGDLPVLGPLFRSTSFQRNESELVIIVTPYVVRPGNGEAMRLPTDNFAPATDLERIFLGEISHQAGIEDAISKIGLAGTRLQGDAGFIQY